MANEITQQKNSAVSMEQLQQKFEEFEARQSSRQSSKPSSLFQYLKNAAVFSTGTLALIETDLISQVSSLATHIANADLSTIPQQLLSSLPTKESVTSLGNELLITAEAHSEVLGSTAAWVTLATGISHLASIITPRMDSFLGRGVSFTIAGVILKTGLNAAKVSTEALPTAGKAIATLLIALPIFHKITNLARVNFNFYQKKFKVD